MRLLYVASAAAAVLGGLAGAAPVVEERSPAPAPAPDPVAAAMEASPEEVHALIVRPRADVAAVVSRALVPRGILEHILPTGGAHGMQAVKNVAKCELCMVLVGQLAKVFGIKTSSLTGGGVTGFVKSVAEKGALWLVERKICQAQLIGEMLNKFLNGAHNPPCLEADRENETETQVESPSSGLATAGKVAAGVAGAGAVGAAAKGLSGSGSGSTGTTGPAGTTNTLGTAGTTGSGSGSGSGLTDITTNQTPTKGSLGRRVATTGQTGTGQTGTGQTGTGQTGAGQQEQQQVTPQYKQGLKQAVSAILQNPQLLNQAKQG